MVIADFLLQHEDVAATGALLTGLGSVIAAFVSIVYANRRSNVECDKRVADVKAAYESGMLIERKFHEQDQETHP